MKNAILILILIAALVGIYFYFNSAKVAGPGTTSTSTGQITQPTKKPTPTANTTTTITAIDASWKTFTSRDGSYSFQYPVKGSLTPTWEQRYVAATDPAVKAFCYTDQNPNSDASRQLVVGGIATCQTTYYEGAAGSTYRTDHILIPDNADRFILLSFTKQYITDTHVLSGCETDLEQQTKPVCAPFDQTRYQATLEQILSTFAKEGVSIDPSMYVR